MIIGSGFFEEKEMETNGCAIFVAGQADLKFCAHVAWKC